MSTSTLTKKPRRLTGNVRAVVMVAMLSAVAFALQFVDFSIPFLIPSFVKMDVSDLPALVGSFSLGPVAGSIICVLKNLLHMIFKGSTGGVGELCNALLGIALVVPASLIYKALNKGGDTPAQAKRVGRRAAQDIPLLPLEPRIGCLVGSVAMAVLSVPINYFITYPMYTMFMPMDVIIGMYQNLLPGVNGLLSCLLIFNMPFTFVKGVLCSIITFIVYKKISGFIKGR